MRFQIFSAIAHHPFVCLSIAATFAKACLALLSFLSQRPSLFLQNTCELANCFAEFLASYFAILGELNCNFPAHRVFKAQSVQNNSPTFAFLFAKSQAHFAIFSFLAKPLSVFLEASFGL